MPITARDPQLKAERGYKHPKSYVRIDGSEVLYGHDWTKRKKELWKRAGGRCERVIGPGARCRSAAHDPHHIIRRSKRRDDRLENLEALCRLHHELADERKVRWNEPLEQGENNATPR